MAEYNGERWLITQKRLFAGEQWVKLVRYELRIIEAWVKEKEVRKI